MEKSDHPLTLRRLRDNRHLRELVADLRSRGIETLLIDPPEYYVLAEDPRYQPYRKVHLQTMKDIANQYGARFIDFNSDSYRDLRRDEALFRNADHLNGLGARVFSTMLADTLASGGR